MTMDDVVALLEFLGCSHVVAHGDEYITCARPDGDNKQGVVVWNNDHRYNVEMYTDPSFSDYIIKDIISLTEHLLDTTLYGALKMISAYFELQEAPKKKKTAMDWLNHIERRIKRFVEPDPILGEHILYGYEYPLHPMWANEGISQEVADRFQIGFCHYAQVITIPIRNEVGELVGVKARATRDQGVKYWYIYEVHKSQTLYGYFENYSAIKEAGEVLVFESEKSVLKAATIGIHNAVAIAGKQISNEQVDLLLRLNVKIIFALDEDVPYHPMVLNYQAINLPIHLADVYAITEAPVDKKSCIADHYDLLADYKKYVKEWTP